MVLPEYIDAIKDLLINNEAYMVIVPGFVLLHARPENGVRGVCLSLVTLNKAVPFGHPTNDPVEVAIAFAAHKSDKHMEIIAEVAALIQDEVRWGIIRNAQNASDVMNAISRE
jgi:mannitol/fructose-specific phosphotransferase system IIA component (Ntr-type)